MAALHFNQSTHYRAKLTQPIQYGESHIFSIFVPLLTTLCMLGLKILEFFCSYQCYDREGAGPRNEVGTLNVCAHPTWGSLSNAKKCLPKGWEG